MKRLNLKLTRKWWSTTAVNDAYQVVFDKLPGVDRYFKKRITGKITPKKTDLLVTLDPGNYSNFGSNEPITERQAVQVQVFVGKETDANLDAIKDMIVSFFAQARWQVTYGPDETTDPETDADTVTLKFARNKERRTN